MPSLTVIEEPVKFHMAVNVSDLAQSIAFYRVLFGAEPAKCHDDYAKFELNDPPVVFSLMPMGVKAGGVMSHAGLRLTSVDAIRGVQQRLEAAGISTRTETDTRGCYAVQSKVWVSDPDGTLWEVYVVKEDIPFGSVSGESMTCATPEAVAAVGGTRDVLYKGPFRELTDDAGRVFPRGRRVTVPADTAEVLRSGPHATQFVVYDSTEPVAGCS